MKELFTKIADAIWKTVSKEAQDLIKKLTAMDPKKRFSAREACAHPWIKKRDFKPLNKEASERILGNLNSFHVLI